jgi:tetratricopeptide (TPR) repeat protein
MIHFHDLGPGVLPDPTQSKLVHKMIGFNSREPYQDAVFDIQTQELAGEKLLETRIYRNGKILASVRRPYREEDPVSAVHEKLSLQHEEICEKVRDGNYSLIFLWISRGIIHYETRDYIKALECFDSVLSIEETHHEVQSYLNDIRSCLQEDDEARQEVTQVLQAQVRDLSREGRKLEAGRKSALLSHLGLPAWHPPEDNGQVPAAPGHPPAHSHPLPPTAAGTPFPMQMLAAAACVLLILCAGLIQADTQIRLNPMYQAKMARKYLENNQVLPARNIYFQLLQQDPLSRDTLAALWDTFHREGDYAEASRTLQELLKKGTPGPELHFCLGEANRLTDRCEEALPLYREALRQGFPATDGKIGLGFCLLEQGRTDEAIRLWEDLLESGNRDYRVEYCLGMAYQQAGRPGRASIFFSQAWKQNPESPIICRALAECLQVMHQTEKARMLHEKAEMLASADRQMKRWGNPGKGPMSRLPATANTSPADTFSPFHRF